MISSEVEEKIIARQLVNFRESSGDLIVKGAYLEIRGMGRILPEDSANDIDQLICYQVNVDYSTSDESCDDVDVLHGIAARKGSSWDLDMYVDADFNTWAAHLCGDFQLRPPPRCLQ